MQDFKSYINQLCKEGEGLEVEFKSAKGGFPESFWETYSAFANTNGGVIVLGIKEKKACFYPDGLNKEQIIHYKKTFWDSSYNKNKVNVSLLNEDEVIVGSYKECSILIFKIPRASRMTRPVYLKANPFGNTYKRNHEGDYRCDDSEVRRMFADANCTNEPQDSRILRGYTIDDIDEETLRQYRQLFSSRIPDHPWNTLDNIDFLKKVGAYRDDRNPREEGFTVAGLLMFGKTESITNTDCVPYYFPDYRESLSLIEQIRWTNRIYPDGRWEANLFQFYNRVYPHIIQSLPTPFILRESTRIEETSAHVAVREAFVNCLVHADYNMRGNIVIERNKKSLVFSNPGNLLIPIEQYYQGGHSECRNPSLQKMFMLIGKGERAGSGTDKIISGWTADQPRKRPLLEEQLNPDRVVLTLTIRPAVNNYDYHISNAIDDNNAINSVSKNASNDVRGNVNDDVDVSDNVSKNVNDNVDVSENVSKNVNDNVSKNVNDNVDVSENVSKNISNNVDVSKNVSEDVSGNVNDNNSNNETNTNDDARKNTISNEELHRLYLNISAQIPLKDIKQILENLYNQPMNKKDTIISIGKDYQTNNITRFITPLEKLEIISVVNKKLLLTPIGVELLKHIIKG